MTRPRNAYRRISRRRFIGGAAQLAIVAGTAPAWARAFPAPASAMNLPAQSAAPRAGAVLDLAEWSYFWLGVERAELSRGTVVNGNQMYVEYMIPTQVRHPYSIVMVHGGGAQGTDWSGTPDGRPGWASYLVQEGFKVYVVDRPGHGRSPFHPDLHGPFERQARTYEELESESTAPEKSKEPYGPQVRFHTQWPGTGMIGDPTLDQTMASGGGAFIADLERTQEIWQQLGTALLDRIGPAIFITHSAGAPFGWLSADARPRLVKAIVAVEPAGPTFGMRQATGRGAQRWGVTASRITYDPPASDSSEIKLVTRPPSTPDQVATFWQAEPPRQLVNLKNIPIGIFTAEASHHQPYDEGTAAFLRQAGCSVEYVPLVEHGIRGNVHSMMKEKNNREIIQLIVQWIGRHASPKDVRPAPLLRSSDPTMLTLADRGYFWVGAEQKKVRYGTIVAGQMYVEYLTPAQVRHAPAVILVHDTGRSALDYMGPGEGLAGWAHYYLREGYRVYLIDLPGHGRAPYHPDALGPIGPLPTYDEVVPSFLRAATGPHRQWTGSGKAGDPTVDRFMAGHNAPQVDTALAHSFWASRAAALLDVTGVAIVQTHGGTSPFGWLAADRRPQLVKAIVTVEGTVSPFQFGWGLAAAPLTYDPPVADPKELTIAKVTLAEDRAERVMRLQGTPARKLKNLNAIPMALVTAEHAAQSQADVAAFLRQAGCSVDELRLPDHGVRGNGHFLMVENNRRLAFDAIRDWVERTAKG